MLFTGKLGNVIGYCRNGKYFLRSAPLHVRRNRATRRAAHRFGIASRRGALLRRAFYDDLDIQRDTSHVNRLNAILMRAGGSNTQAAAGFRFNEHTGTDHFFTFAPVFSADGTFHIPPQVLPVFKGITGLEVKVIAARINFSSRTIEHTDAALLMLDTQTPFSGVTIPMDIHGAGTLVVMMQVRAMQDDRPSFNRRYQAADIIFVQAPSVQQRPKKKKGPRTHCVSLQQPPALAAGNHTPHHQLVIQRE